MQFLLGLLALLPYEQADAFQLSPKAPDLAAEAAPCAFESLAQAQTDSSLGEALLLLVAALAAGEHGHFL